MSSNRMNQCEAIGSNHSTNLVAVYAGQATPFYLCGYHSTYHTQDSLRQARLKRKARGKQAMNCQHCNNPTALNTTAPATDDGLWCEPCQSMTYLDN